MKSLLLVGAVASAINMGLVTVEAGTFETSPQTLDEINVTSDSSPGWLPTPEQRQHAINAVRVFLDAIESGRYVEAYGMEADVNKRDQTLAQFSADAQKFSALAGPAKFWRVLKVTWTKDPARAPFRGVYVAIDLAGQFANVDRDCGYIVMYQAPAGGEFTVMRRENSFMDNATARKIEAEKSKGEVARIWGQLARYCPNYASPPDAQ